LILWAGGLGHWQRPRHSPPPPLGPSVALAPTGSLFYGTCDLPQCDTLALALYNLANASGRVLFDFPLDAFEDGYVEDSLVVPGTSELVISLQYDGNPNQGYLLSFDLATSKVLGGFNSSFCFSVFLDPSNPDTLLCLALQGASQCGAGAQCTQLRHISRTKHTDTLVGSFLPGSELMSCCACACRATLVTREARLLFFFPPVLPPGFAPYTVTCFDTKRGLMYSTFSNLNTGLNVLAAIDPTTGHVVSNVTFPYNVAYIELEYDPVSDKVYAVVEDAQQGTFFGTVEPSTGVATPVSSSAYFNTTQWNQFNTIRCGEWVNGARGGWVGFAGLGVEGGSALAVSQMCVLR
jgi:hypothetical protein